MKFQNPSFNFFEQTDGRTSRNQYASHFFKVGGIKRRHHFPHNKYIRYFLDAECI